MKKKLLLLIVLLSAAWCVNAQSERTIHVETAGTLNTFISEDDKYSITKLTLTGQLNGKDMKLLRDMGGMKDVSTKTKGTLADLDMGGTSIVASDDVYFSYNGEFTSENDVFGSFFLYGCSQLTRLVLPSGITRIGEMALSSCTKLASIDIPSQVTVIGRGAFVMCSSVKNLVIPDNVVTIETGAFQRMDALQTISLGNGIETLENSLFLQSTSLKKVILGTNFKNFDPMVFYTTASLAEIEVNSDNPLYATSEGILFNKDFTKLISYPPSHTGETYTIPASVKTVGNFAFTNATRLQTMNIPSTVEDLSSAAFSGCSNLQSVTLNEGLKSMGLGVFAMCNAMSEVTIPASVSLLEEGVFFKMDRLSSIIMAENNDNYTVKDGLLYTKDLSTLICLPSALETEKFESIPEVTKIGDYAISGNQHLTSIYLGDAVKTIGTNAVIECNALERIVLGTGIQKISEYAFVANEAITEIYLYATALTEENVHPMAFLDEFIMGQTTLYVPKGKLDFYTAQNWVVFRDEEEEIPLFAAVEEMTDEMTGIDNTVTEKQNNDVKEIYSIDGSRQQKLQRGINIIKSADGKSRKVLVP